MPEEFINQYLYFIQDCKTVEAVLILEKKLDRCYGVETPLVLFLELKKRKEQLK